MAFSGAGAPGDSGAGSTAATPSAAAARHKAAIVARPITPFAIFRLDPESPPAGSRPIIAAQAVSATDEMSGGDDLALDRIERFLSDNVAGFRGPLTAERFAGGQSNPTYRLRARSGEYVLRKKPPGPLLPSAHAVDREFRVMRALARTAVPVPQVYALCEDEAVTGSAFFVMEHLDGRIFWDQRLPGISPDERGRMFQSMNRVIADLHSVDYAALGLDDFGRPGNYMARQIAR